MDFDYVYYVNKEDALIKFRISRNAVRESTIASTGLKGDIQPLAFY